LFEMLPMMPRFTIERVRQQLDTTFPTATAAVKVLEDLGIVAEMTGQKKTEVTATRPTSNCSLGDKYAPFRSLAHWHLCARRVGLLWGNRPPPIPKIPTFIRLGFFCWSPLETRRCLESVTALLNRCPLIHRVKNHAGFSTSQRLGFLGQGQASPHPGCVTARNEAVHCGCRVKAWIATALRASQ
jgi:hypothetical protein